MNDALRDLEKTEDRYHETYLQLLKERAKWQKLKDYAKDCKNHLKDEYEDCDHCAGIGLIEDYMRELEKK
jgi:hypothetical protein